MRGTGNGESDFYRFVVNDLDRGRRVKASFDIDRGFEFGDPILWLSLLKLYNAQRRPARPGPGLLRPVRRRPGGGG